MVEEKLKRELEENGLDTDELDELCNQFCQTERRRLTLRRNSARGSWRNVPSRLFSQRGPQQQQQQAMDKRRPTRRESHLTTATTGLSARTSVTGSFSSGGGMMMPETVTYESMIREIWDNDDNQNELNEIFIKSLRDFVDETSGLKKLMREEMEKFENFEKSLRY